MYAISKIPTTYENVGKYYLKEYNIPYTGVFVSKICEWAIIISLAI